MATRNFTPEQASATSNRPDRRVDEHAVDRRRHPLAWVSATASSAVIACSSGHDLVAERHQEQHVAEREQQPGDHPRPEQRRPTAACSSTTAPNWLTRLIPVAVPVEPDEPGRLRAAASPGHQASGRQARRARRQRSATSQTRIGGISRMWL